MATSVDSTMDDVSEQAASAAGGGTHAAPATTELPRLRMRFGGEGDAVEEFNYRPMPVLVPLSLMLAVTGLTAFIGAVGVVISAVALMVAVLARWKVKSGLGQYSGLGLATFALLVSATTTFGGIAQQAYLYHTEVPEGFQRVSFSREIASYPVQTFDAQNFIHKEVAKLQDRNVFLKGYVYPQRETIGLTQFLLLKDTGECCFGGQPKPTDMILVEMQNDVKVNYREGCVAVAGKFKIEPSITEEGLQPVYRLECVRFGPSRSSF